MQLPACGARALQHRHEILRVPLQRAASHITNHPCLCPPGSTAWDVVARSGSARYRDASPKRRRKGLHGGPIHSLRRPATSGRVPSERGAPSHVVTPRPGNRGNRGRFRSGEPSWPPPQGESAGISGRPSAAGRALSATANGRARDHKSPEMRRSKGPAGMENPMSSRNAMTGKAFLVGRPGFKPGTKGLSPANRPQKWRKPSSVQQLTKIRRGLPDRVPGPEPGRLTARLSIRSCDARRSMVTLTAPSIRSKVPDEDRKRRTGARDRSQQIQGVGVALDRSGEPDDETPQDIGG
jgi:hypothetical protein